MLGTWTEAQAQLGGRPYPGHGNRPPFLGPRQGKPSLLCSAQAPLLSQLRWKDDLCSQRNLPEAAGAKQVELRLGERAVSRGPTVAGTQCL